MRGLILRTTDTRIVVFYFLIFCGCLLKFYTRYVSLRTPQGSPKLAGFLHRDGLSIYYHPQVWARCVACVSARYALRACAACHARAVCAPSPGFCARPSLWGNALLFRGKYFISCKNVSPPMIQRKSRPNTRRLIIDTLRDTLDTRLSRRPPCSPLSFQQQ